MYITKKVLILSVIAMLALGVFAMALPKRIGNIVTQGPTCQPATLTVNSNINVVQGFEATATSYDATFCGATGFLLAGTEAVGIASNGTGGASLSVGTDGGLGSLLQTYGTGPYTGRQISGPMSSIANNDLVLAAVTVLSNYSQVSITVGVEGANIPSGQFGALGLVASSWDNANWSQKQWLPSVPYMQGNTLYTQVGTLGLTMTPINTGASPYAGFLFIYTVYKGANPASDSAQLSNQIAPWVQAGKYPVTFTFTINPTFVF